MILPKTLSPLPVCPSGDDPAGADLEDFVAAGAVRKAILGTSELPVVEVLPVDDFDDCFAGRADFPLPKRAAKWTPRPQARPATKVSRDSARAQLAADLGIHLAPEPAESRKATAKAGAAAEIDPDELELPDMALETPVVHPAFEVIPPASRRAAPPQLQPRERADCEAAYGSRNRGGERWWVIGMGLAACAVLFSGTLVDFISREAMRRSHVEALALPVKSPNAATTARAGASAVPVPAASTAQGTADEKALPLAATAKDDDKPE